MKSGTIRKKCWFPNTPQGIRNVIRAFIIRSRRGSKRVFLFFAASLILVSSTAPSLATVSYDKTSTVKLGPIEYSVSVSAFLNASGIYPYAVGQNFDEWTEEGLDVLIEQFNEAQPANSLSNLPSFRVIQNAANRVIAYPKEAWNRLRAFANWLISNFSLTDNQEGVQVGTFSGGYNIAVKTGGVPTYNELVQYGTLFAVYTASSTPIRYYALSDTPGALLIFMSGSGSDFVAYGGDYSGTPVHFYYAASNNKIVSTSTWEASLPVGGSSQNNNALAIYEYGGKKVSVPFGYFGPTHNGTTYQVDVPTVSRVSGYWTFDPQSLINTYYGIQSTFSGIIADTSTVSVPPELPADTEYGGLFVAPSVEMADSSETDLSVPTDIVAVIEAGVENHNRPIVTPVGVVLAPDVVINPDTGELTPTEVEIDFSNIPLSPSQYALPGLHTLFPLSIPWDIASTLSALNAAPVRPEFEVSLYVPFLENPVPFTIGFPEEVAPSVDAFMIKFRAMLLVLMCVGFLWFVFQFLVPR